MKTLLKLFVIAIFLISYIKPNALFAQDNNSVWNDIPEQAVRSAEGAMTLPLKFRSLNLNLISFRNILASAPFEFTDRALNSPFVIELPTPDGRLSKFYVTEYSMMEPGLASQYPGIKTYNIKGIDDPYAVGKIDVTMSGFHGMILTPNGDYFIDPVSRENTDNYISYFKSDYPGKQPFECFVKESIDNTDLIKNHNSDMTGQQLRTYRIAVAADGEYTVFHGGTVALGQAAIVVAVNRVNGVYEREVAVRLVLIANNSLLVYTNPATDPYTNNNSSALVAENQANVDAVIGSANYDIGHVFTTGGGGLAYFGVCNNSLKASACTGTSSPIGDPYYIDFVAHEVGHQFWGNHTFNGTTGSCAGNRNPTTAWEPGSGSTIMPYAGICAPQDLQPNSDAYFHTGSVSEITAFTQTGQGNTCPVITNTGNTPPTVTVPAGGFTIPISTPFALTGSATDTETPGTLTYCWEEFDLGPAGAPTAPSGNAPIFRSFSPVVSSTRTFPKLSDLLNNTSTIGEILPTYTRGLSFRLTARDNAAGGGGINFNTISFNVSAASGPFVVTSPNTNVTWAAGAQTVTWNVANTTAAPVSCALVNIKLSTDGGNTFQTTLLASTANDGSQSVTIPNINTSLARIKVESVGNVFFDISNTNFIIGGGSLPALCEDFSGATFAPTDWSIEFTGTNYWTRNTVSSYGVGTGSAKFNFFDAPTATVQSLVTLTFQGSIAGDSLKFDNAYAPYTDGSTDSLEILSSTNGGTSYSSLVRLWGNNVNGNLNTAAPTGSAFTPTAGQWATKKYSLPVGTNKVKFRSRAGFGNNLYLDSICKVSSSSPVAATITIAPQGYYESTTNRLNIRDTVTFYLRNISTPFAIVDSGKAVIDSVSLSGSVTFANAVSGTYYIVVKSRNILETWSKSGGQSYTRGAAFSYNFTTAAAQSYGSNMILEGAKYCIYSGDVSKNNAVDLGDIVVVYNAASAFTTGFNALDLTGDRTVDLTDVLIAFNNSSNFVSRQAPPGAVIISGNPITISAIENVNQDKTDIQKIEESVIIEKNSVDKRNNDMKSNTNKK